MGKAIDIAIDLTGIGFIPVIGDLVKKIHFLVWNEVVMPVLETVVGIFGIRDEDVISTSVMTQRLVNDETSIKYLMTQLALAHQKDPDKTVIEKFIQMTSPTRDKYSSYFKYGRDTYVNGLPQTSIGVQVVDLDEIKRVLDGVIGSSSTIVSGELRFPTDDEYVISYLINNYNYNILTKQIDYLGDVYVVTSWSYNSGTNQFDVQADSLEDVTTTTTTTTIVSVSPLDDTTDTITTTVSTHTTVVGTIGGSYSDTTSSSSSTSTAAKGTVTPSSNTNVVTSVLKDQIAKEKFTVTTTVGVVTSVTNLNETTDTVTTTTTTQVTTVGSVAGLISSTSNTVVSSSTAPTGTVTSGSTSETTVTYYFENYPPVFIPIPMYTITHHYVVKYYTTSASEEKFWVYDPTTNVHPTLKSSADALTNLDMFPIIVLRNGTVNITSDKESDEYKHSKKLCNFLGIEIDSLVDTINESPDIGNVEDAFIHFAIDPKDTSETVSEALYSMFNYIGEYSDLIKVVSNGVAKYQFTMMEGPVNVALGWTDQRTTIMTGVINSVGKYAHAIEEKTIKLQKQITDNTYSEIILENVSSATFIDRQGLVGMSATSPLDEGFVIPISYQFVNKLAPLKQTELFVKSMQLSIYAAEVTHLEWYETEGFMVFIQVVAFVVMVVVTVVTLGAGTPLIAIIQQILINMAIGALATIALMKLYEATDNEFLRAVLTVAIVVAAVYFQQSNMAGEFLNASQLISSVSNSAFSVISVGSQLITYGSQVSGILLAEEYEALNLEASSFEEKSTKKFKEISALQEDLESAVSVDFAAMLKRWVESGSYLESTDLFIYKAIQIQYDYDLLYDYSNMKSAFYDNKLRLGVV